jgi:SAM-dependent methyltransferase
MVVDPGARLRSLYEPQGGVTGVFSAKADDYVASRPGYPPQLFQLVEARCPPRPGVAVADVGSGTGLLTAGLLQLGYDVTAVEPNAEMRAVGDQFVAGQARYRSLGGSAESIPLADGSVDLITVAQAFHWFDVDRTRLEFRRILRPGGLVTLIWNDRRSEHPLHVALEGIFAAFGGEKWRAVASHEQQRAVPRFFGKAPAQFTWPNQHDLDEHGLVSLVFSRSYMPPRESAAGQDAIARARDVFANFAQGGRVTVLYRTIAYLDQPI